MMEFNELRDLFRQVFESQWQPDELEEFEELRERFAFHMSDVYRNLMDLAKIYESDSVPAVAQVTDEVELFFNHALPHLIAAANIIGDIPQIHEEQNGVHDWKSFVDEADDVDVDDVAKPTSEPILKPVK